MLHGSDVQKSKAGSERVALLVTELEALLTIPRVHVQKYMSLRSDRSIERLSKVLKDYKKASGSDRASVTTRSHSTNTRGTPRSGQAAHRATSKQHEKEKHEKVNKLAEMRQKMKELTWQSTYNNFFSNTSGSSAVQNGTAKSGGHRGVLGKVWKDDQWEYLEQWLATASDDHVRELVDLCRGLRSVQAHGQKGTEYRRQFLQAPVYSANHVVPFENKGNLSSVPIGSIYRTDPWELEASENRHKETTRGLQRVTEQQEKMMNHKKFPKTVEELIFIDPRKANKPRFGSADVNACFSECPRNYSRSEYKTAFVAFGGP